MISRLSSWAFTEPTLVWTEKKHRRARCREWSMHGQRYPRQCSIKWGDPPSAFYETGINRGSNSSGPMMLIRDLLSHRLTPASLASVSSNEFPSIASQKKRGVVVWGKRKVNFQSKHITQKQINANKNKGKLRNQ